MQGPVSLIRGTTVQGKAAIPLTLIHATTDIDWFIHLLNCTTIA